MSWLTLGRAKHTLPFLPAPFCRPRSDFAQFHARHSQASCVQERLQAESATADRFPVWFRSATRVFGIVPACRPLVFLPCPTFLLGHHRSRSGPPSSPCRFTLSPRFFLYLDFCRVLFAIKCITRSVCPVPLARLLVRACDPCFHGLSRIRASRRPPRLVFAECFKARRHSRLIFAWRVTAWTSRRLPRPVFAKCFKDVGFGRPL